MTSTPAVVLVHGAWFDASCWEPVIAELRRRGASAVAVDLPLNGFDADVALVRNAIEAAGPGAVVVAHSYGGCVVSAAAGNLEVAQLFYVAAFLTEPDEHPFTILAQHQGELLEALVVNDTGVDVDPIRARDIFFGDQSDGDAAALSARLRQMPLNGAEMDFETPAWKATPSTYLLCTEDRALPVAAQRWMAARADRIVEWPADHCPFLSRPADLATLVLSRSS